MELYQIKNEIRQLSMIDDRYKFSVETEKEKIIIELFSLVGDRHIKQSNILEIIDKKEFYFDKNFKKIENKTIKSLLVYLACNACDLKLGGRTWNC